MDLAHHRRPKILEKYTFSSDVTVPVQIVSVSGSTI